jgi:hypothetical protein
MRRVLGENHKDYLDACKRLDGYLVQRQVVRTSSRRIQRAWSVKQEHRQALLAAGARATHRCANGLPPPPAAAAAAAAEARGSARCGGCVCGAVRRLGVSAYLLLCGGGAVALLACVAVRAPDAFLFDATVLAHLGAAGSSHHPHPPTVATAAASPPMRRGWRRRTSEHMCVMMGVAV